MMLVSFFFCTHNIFGDKYLEVTETHTNPEMPIRSTTFNDDFKEWFQQYFTFAVINVLLIVFCVLYCSIELHTYYPFNDLRTTSTASWFTEEKFVFPGSNMLNGLQTDLSNIVFNFYVMQWCTFFLAVYMAYILREMYYVQLHSQRVVYERLECILNSEGFERILQDVKAVSDDVVDKCDVFEGLLKKIIRIMPEHPTDVKDAVYSLHDTTEDLLSKIKREIRTLRLEYNASKPEEKEEMVELSVSSTEVSEAPVVPPTITPKLKRGRKLTTPSPDYSSTPLLSSTRLGSRRANEMIQKSNVVIAS